MSWDHPPNRSSNDCYQPPGYAWATWEGEDNRRISIWAYWNRIAAVRWYAGHGRANPKSARSKMIIWPDHSLGILESLEAQEERDAQWNWLWNMGPTTTEQVDIY